MMSDHGRKATESDPGHVTIPPALQGFVGRRERPKVQRRGEDAALDAAFGQLEGVAGAAPAVDAIAQDLTRGAGNLSAYVAPVEAPAAAPGVRQTGKVKINVPEENEEDKEGPPSSGLGLRLDARTGRLMAQAAKKAAEESPWAQETATVPLGAGVLPSSLAPAAKTEPAPPSVQEKPAGVPQDGNRGARVMGVLAVVAVIGYAAFQLMPKAPVVEALVPVPVRSAAPAAVRPEVSGAAVVPSVVPSASAVVPAATVEVDAGASVAASAQVLAPTKMKTKIEDPYDAAAPSPAKTVEAVVIPPPALTALPAVPVPKPSALPTVPATGPIGGPPQY
jgi:hypothetical protein